MKVDDRKALLPNMIPCLNELQLSKAIHQLVDEQSERLIYLQAEDGLMFPLDTPSNIPMAPMLLTGGPTPLIRALYPKLKERKLSWF